MNGGNYPSLLARWGISSCSYGGHFRPSTNYGCMRTNSRAVFGEGEWRGRVDTTVSTSFLRV